jgi:nicotinamidase-related amidase
MSQQQQEAAMGDAMIEQPSIPQASSALVLNDMINANFRTKNPTHNKLIDESGIIPNSVRLVAAIRERRVPIFWIRVERRADYADAIFPLTDAFLASGQKRSPALLRGSFEAANVDELPVQPEDQVVLKPRINPFIGTDLDLQLRARKINTILYGGYSTNMGVESGVRTARDLGYDVVVLSDCCYNVDRELHEWSLTKIMPTYARVLASKRVLELLK